MTKKKPERNEMGCEHPAASYDGCAQVCRDRDAQQDAALLEAYRLLDAVISSVKRSLPDGVRERIDEWLLSAPAWVVAEFRKERDAEEAAYLASLAEKVRSRE